MFSAIWLVALGTFLSEQASIRIKKYDNLHPFQKAIIVSFFLSIVTAITAIGFNQIKYNLNIFHLLGVVYLIFWIIGFYYFAMKSIEVADRSTSAIFSVLALPLLLISDILLWYNVNKFQIIWVLFITLVLLLISYKGSLNLKWLKYILATTAVAFFNTVIFKYLISHWWSVPTVLFLQSFFAFILLSIYVSTKLGVEKIKEIIHKQYISIGLFRSTNTLLVSLAYMFWPASIIAALKRIFMMFRWVVFGHFVFHESNIGKKLSNVAILSIGIFIMNAPAFANNLAWFKQKENIATDILNPQKAKIIIKPDNLNNSDLIVGM